MTGVVSAVGKDASTQVLPASLLEVSPGGFRIAIPSRIEEGARIHLRLGNGDSLSGTLRFCCEVNGDEFHAGVQYAQASTDRDRRTEPRFPVCHSAQLTVIGSVTVRDLNITVTNLSRSGMGARSVEPLTAGVAVEVRLSRYVVFGIVRHCRARAGVYDIGIVITDMLTSQDPRMSAEESGVTRLRGQIRELARHLRIESRSVLPKLKCWFHDVPAAPSPDATLLEIEPARPTGSGCSFYAEHRKGPSSGVHWNCEVCEAVERWRSEKRTLVLCREILDGRGVYIQAVDSDQPPGGGFLLQLRFVDAPSMEIRVTLQTIVSAAEQTWIALSDRSVRIR